MRLHKSDDGQSITLCVTPLSAIVSLVLVLLVVWLLVIVVGFPVPFSCILIQPLAGLSCSAAGLLHRKFI